MNNLAIIIEYFFKDKNVAEPFSSLTIRNDGEGEFISYWNDSVLGAKPSDSELSAIESDALAWDKARNGRTISAGDFIAELPLTLQGDFDDLVIKGIRGARVLDRFIKTNGTLHTNSAKTRGSVMFLAGIPIPDEKGVIQQLIDDDIMLTMTQAEAWLAGDKVEI